MKAKAIKHNDVQGNELMYIALMGKNGTFKLLKSGPSTISWMEEQGEKVYGTVGEAAMSDQPELPVKQEEVKNEQSIDNTPVDRQRNGRVPK